MLSPLTLVEVVLVLIPAAALIISTIIKVLGGLAQILLNHWLEQTPPTATSKDESSDKALT